MTRKVRCTGGWIRAVALDLDVISVEGTLQGRTTHIAASPVPGSKSGLLMAQSGIAEGDYESGGGIQLPLGCITSAGPGAQAIGLKQGQRVIMVRSFGDTTETTPDGREVKIATIQAASEVSPVGPKRAGSPLGHFRYTGEWKSLDGISAILDADNYPRAIGRRVIVRPVDHVQVASDIIQLSSEDLGYVRGEVLDVGKEVTTVSTSHCVYYNPAVASTWSIDGQDYASIRESDLMAIEERV